MIQRRKLSAWLWTLIALGACALPASATTPAAPLEDAGHDHGHAGETHNFFVHEKSFDTPSELFSKIFQHLSPVWYIEGVVSNHHVFFVVAFLVVLVLFVRLASARKSDLRPRGRLQNLLESMVLFVRDEMVYRTMGKEIGARFLPLFLTQFFFILVMNLFGILPSFGTPGHDAGFPTTVTANISVTAGLGIMTLCVMLVAGIKEQGFGHFVINLAPSVKLGPGPANALMEKVVLGILYPIEILGLLIKPLALAIRLFANMTGGHMALLTIYGLSYFALAMLGKWVGIPITGVALVFNICLTFLELLVAVLQAYIFTFLSIIFVNASVHPDH